MPNPDVRRPGEPFEAYRARRIAQKRELKFRLKPHLRDKLGDAGRRLLLLAQSAARKAAP